MIANAPTPSVTPGQLVSALIGATASLLVVSLVHLLTIKRETTSHKKERLEKLYLESRRLLADYSLTTQKLLEAAEGKISTKAALTSISERTNSIYDIGSSTRPFSQCEMLIGLYFPRLDPWLKTVIGQEIRVRQLMHEHASSEGVTPHHDAMHVSLLNHALRIYADCASQMSELLREEIVSLDRPWWRRVEERVRQRQ